MHVARRSRPRCVQTFATSKTACESGSCLQRLWSSRCCSARPHGGIWLGRLSPSNGRQARKRRILTLRGLCLGRSRPQRWSLPRPRQHRLPRSRLISVRRRPRPPSGPRVRSRLRTLARRRLPHSRLFPRPGRAAQRTGIPVRPPAGQERKVNTAAKGRDQCATCRAGWAVTRSARRSSKAVSTWTVRRRHRHVCHRPTTGITSHWIAAQRDMEVAVETRTGRTRGAYRRHERAS